MIEVDEYIAKQNRWQDELKYLRKLLNKKHFKEEIKWGAPVYTLEGKNLIGLGAFKSYVGIWFFQGALLSDKKNMLVNAQENKTKAMRQLRFNSLEEISANSNLIKNFILETITNFQSGKMIKPEKAKTLTIPEELSELLNRNKKLGNAFNSLIKSKQREFCEYIIEAKKESTKLKRLEKIKPLILQGVGLNDKYKK